MRFIVTFMSLRSVAAVILMKEVSSNAGSSKKGPKPKVSNPGKLLPRILKYVMKSYKFSCIVVAVWHFD